MAKKPVDTPLPPDILAKLEAIAEQAGKSVQALIEQALRDWLSDIEAGRRPRT